MALQLRSSLAWASPGVTASRARSSSASGTFVERSRERGWSRCEQSAHLRSDGGRIVKSHPVARDPWSSSCELEARCASSREDFMCDSEETSLIFESCEHSNSPIADSVADNSSDYRRTRFREILTRLFFSFGDCSSPNSCAQSLGGACRSFSAALLSSSIVVTAPGLAFPAPVALPASDLAAAAVTLAGALGILQFFDELAKRNLLEKKLSRKLCHISSGMVFMLFWPLFSAVPLAKYLAAFAPAANGLRMIGLGFGLWKNDALVKAISRGGNQSELLQGPLYYAITITVATLFFWRRSPVGACAVATLCAGDGFADIVGRKWGKHKLPYNSRKSILGTVAFFVAASLACVGYVAYFAAFGFFTATPEMYMASVGVALASGIVESLPLPFDDNFTVPFTAIGVGMLLLPL